MENRSWFDVSDIHVVPIQLNFIILNTVFAFIRHEIKALHSTLNSIEAPNKKPISLVIFGILTYYDSNYIQSILCDC